MKVKFVPQNVEYEIKMGQSVLHVAQDHDIYVKSVCKGVPSCAECRVRIVDGEHNVLPPGSEELSLIGTGYFIDRRRLSCQLKCFGDITVDMSEQIAKQQGLIGGQKKRKLAVKDDRIEDARAIRSSEASDDEPSSGEERVQEASESPAPEPRREGRRENRDQRPRGGGGGRGPRPERAAKAPDSRPPQGAAPVEGEGEEKAKSGRRRRRRGGRGRGPEDRGPDNRGPENHGKRGGGSGNPPPAQT